MDKITFHKSKWLKVILEIKDNGNTNKISNITTIITTTDLALIIKIRATTTTININSNQIWQSRLQHPLICLIEEIR